MKHLQYQTYNRQKSDGLRQALNREVNIPNAHGIPECPPAFSNAHGIPGGVWRGTIRAAFASALTL
jgi:hypothetical protein